jgi:hypothetical protein
MQTDTELVNCNTRKNQYQSYDVGGKYSTMGDYSSYVAKLKKDYINAGCGQDVAMEKCFSDQQYIDTLSQSIKRFSQMGNLDYVESNTPILLQKTKEFNASNCNNLIAKRKQIFLDSEINKYQSLDSQRINAESKFQANKKFFIGASVLLIGVTLILVIKSK